MTDPSHSGTPTDAPDQSLLSARPASAAYTPPWRDYLAYFTVRRILTIFYALAVVELGAWVSVYMLPAGFGGLRRAVSGQARSDELMKADPFLGHRLRAGVEMAYRSEGRQVRVRTTDFGLGDVGFRDLGMPPPFDIVALGDSFVYCDDISPEGCWLRLLGDRTGLSVGDLGVPGYSTLAQARLLERYGPPLHPRIVLVTVFANDFRDNQQFDRWLHSGSDDFPEWLGRQRRRGAVGQTLARHLLVFRIFLAARRGNSRQMQNHKDDKLDLSFSFDPWWIDLTKHAGENPGFRLMQEALLGMRAQAEQIGAQLVVLFLPTKEEVYWDIARQYTQPDLDVDHPRAVVRKFCETKGLKFCEVTDDLRAEARSGRQLYLRVSGHWNEAGHALMADATARCLREQGLLEFATTRQAQRRSEARRE